MSEGLFLIIFCIPLGVLLLFIRDYFRDYQEWKWERRCQEWKWKRRCQEWDKARKAKLEEDRLCRLRQEEQER